MKRVKQAKVLFQLVIQYILGVAMILRVYQLVIQNSVSAVLEFSSSNYCLYFQRAVECKSFVLKIVILAFDRYFYLLSYIMNT